MKKRDPRLFIKDIIAAIESIETFDSVILPETGEKISSHLQIIGTCPISGSYLTRYSARYCRNCGRTVSSTHARYLEEEKRHVCEDCARRIRRREILRFIAGFFIERKEDDKS